MARPRRRKLQVVPEFTGSLDARVPAEKITLVHQVEGTERWFAASQSSDGRYFLGFGATEPLARRAAGLRTLAHLEARAKGSVSDRSEADIEAARAELVAELDELRKHVEGYNGEFPAYAPRAVVLIQIDAAREVVRNTVDPGILARWVAPPAAFIAGAFAEGVIGAYAQKVVDLVTKLVSG